MEEEWRLIEGSKGYYVSNLGRIKNSKGVIMKPHTNHGGTYVIGIRRSNDKHWTCTVPNIVATIFLKKPFKNCKKVDHLDGDRANNSVNNLRWHVPEFHNNVNQPMVHKKRLDKLFYQALHSIEHDYGKVTNVSSDDKRWQFIKTYR